MLGAIIGDICGSVYEFNNRKTTNPSEINLVNKKCYFTDDTVLTVATAEVLLQKRNYTDAYKEWGCRYLHAGFGGTFWKWMQTDNREPYNSCY